MSKWKVLDARTRRIDEKHTYDEVLVDYDNGKPPVWMMCKGSANGQHTCRRKDIGLPPLGIDSCLCSGVVHKTDYGKERDLVRDVETNADEIYLVEALYKEVAGGGEYKSIIDRIADMRE